MLPPELGLLEHLFPATMSTWEALISAAKWLYMLPARVHSRVGIYARGECCRSSCSTARCPSFRTSWGAPVPGSQDVVHMGWIQPLSKVQHGTANTKTKGTPLIILFLCPVCTGSSGSGSVSDFGGAWVSVFCCRFLLGNLNGSEIDNRTSNGNGRPQQTGKQHGR